MSATKLTNNQLGTNSVQRNIEDTSDTGKAVISKVIAGTGIGLSSTGADSGTGDVTISVSGSIGSLTVAYVAKTANYNIASTDCIIEATANSFTLTLPTAVGKTGQIYILKNSGNGTITVNTTSSQTIDGNLTEILHKSDSMTVVSNGANWIII